MRTTITVYIGTYTSGASEGIYVCRFATETGALSLQRVVSGIENPSFLALDPTQRRLYAVNETDNFGGADTGAVSAFAIDADSGDVQFLNQQATGGGWPCHIAVDRTGTHALVANYKNGSVALLPLARDGRLEPLSDLEQHTGRGTHPQRQRQPHAHSVTLDATNRFVFVADLGTNKLMAYHLNGQQHTLTLASETVLHPGAGPRHFAFHPNRPYAYVINELDSSVTAFAFDAQTGGLEALQTISTLPEGYTEANTCADIHVAPSGRFLYGSNRGHDSIVVYAIAEDGRLTFEQHMSTGGQTPRNFALDPTGTFLLAANQNSDSIVTFRINAETGHLSSTDHRLTIPTPVCIRFAPGV